MLVRIRQSEMGFHTLFEQSPNPMALYSLEGVCFAVNKAWTLLYKTQEAHALGYNVIQDPQVAALGLLPFITKAFRGEEVQSPAFYYDPSVIGKPGRARWLEAHFFPIREVDGYLIAIVNTLKDVTREKEAEAEKKMGEAKFRTLSVSMEQLIWSCSADGNITYANQKCESYTGIPISPGSLGHWLSALHPEDSERSQREWWNSVITGSHFECRYRLRRFDGAYRWFLGRAVPERDLSGKILGWVGTATDIHEQMLAEETQRFLSEATSILISSLDQKSLLEKIADLSVRRFGGWCVIHLLNEESLLEAASICHESKELVEEAKKRAKTFSLLEEPCRGPGKVAKSNQAVFIPEVSDDHLRETAEDEEHYNQLKAAGIRTAMCIPLGTSRGVIGTLTILRSGSPYTEQDFSFAEELARRCSFALENSRLYQEAQKAVQARDDLLSITSHELRTPITSMVLQLQMAKRLVQQESSIPDRLARAVDLSLEQTKRLTKLVEDLLLFSKVSSGRLEYQFRLVNLGSLVTDVLERFTDQIKNSGSKVETWLDPSVEIICDPMRMDQVVLNLVSNAIKYGEGRPFRVSVARSKNCASLEVRDRGIGIEKGKHSMIFDRFVRAVPHGNISGFGLGLYIAREIVEAHEGSIRVESEPGCGSTFTVELPLADSASAKP